MKNPPDVLVLGSGIAGLFFALKCARFGRVAVVTKKDQPESNTNYAQGGIAAALAPDDSPDLHARDTYIAGAGLCHTDAVEALVREGPRRVRELIELGARFSTHAGDLSLGREGGHSRRRIVRAADLTGREVERALLDAVAAEPAIEIYENHMAVDLLVGRGPDADRRCTGALVLGADESLPTPLHAKAVMVATGGYGQVYAHTTNPAIATGDGIAMAYRAGAKIANMEFVQFHPTALYPAGDRAFLISEAVRGEGAILRRRDGTAFMDRYHPLGSLAPRDVVALAIDRELKETGDPFVLLDCSPIGEDEIRTHFPNILAETSARGIDMLRESLPVVPAAHYGCGGILTDTTGRTSLPGLYAIGEAACTGVHGANRLASNSLLEALVFAGRAAEQIGPRLAEWTHGQGEPAAAPIGTANQAVDPSPLRAEVRGLMWDLVGIVRADSRLLEASRALADIQERFSNLARRSALTPDLLELRNLIQCSVLIVDSSLAREESRGLNFNVDHPYRDNERFLADTVISLWNEGSHE
jgi:L-aspartate oxidase